VKEAMFEKLLEASWIMEDDSRDRQDQASKRHIVANWVEYAYMMGDKTWKLFCDNPINPACVHYQKTIHNHRDFIIPEVDEILKGVDDGKLHDVFGSKSAEEYEEGSGEESGAGKDSEEHGHSECSGKCEPGSCACDDKPDEGRVALV
jgi:hypothetical protein